MPRAARAFLLVSTLQALAACGQPDDTGFRAAPWELASIPAQYDFGAVGVGVRVDLTLSLSNLGSGSADISQITLGGSGGGAFVLPESWNGEIGGGGSHDVSLSFAPDEEGLFQETLVVSIVSSGDIEVLEVPLRGTGVLDPLRAWPLVADFGPVPVGETEDLDLTVENLTDGDVPIFGVEIETEDDSPGFDAENPSDFESFPWIVAARSTLEIPLSYHASSEDPVEGTLWLLGEGGIELGVEIELRANVCEGSGHPDWDSDEDGVTVCGGDCDDDDDTVFPGAPEVGCDTIDNDCDGVPDDGTPCHDDDGDGFTEAAGDCNDSNPATYPGAEEIVDGQDNDCDLDVDEGTTADDADGDGYTGPAGDCDDTNPLVWPGAEELEDGVDNDCDTTIDETTSVYDDDGDGYCDNDIACIGSFIPGDCNDGDDTVSPAAVEVANGVDDDCNGIVDNGTDASDDDGDGYTEAGGDCDDSEPATYPGAPELADAADNDCDGETDEGTVNVDDDGDNFSESMGDCNDTDPGIYPGADEDFYAANSGEGDGMDNDCDGTVDEETTWYDDDGDGFSEFGGDCDDDDPAYSPGVWDAPGDGEDWDCNGSD
jgi:hypothetical protein